MIENPTRPIRRWGTGDDSRTPAPGASKEDLDTPFDDTTGVPTFERGARFARFFILERLGVGGMGVVVSAYDPDLDRKVAIKVLRHDPSGGGAAPAARGRMLVEAKAMARLAHPNVVTVHEVGTSRDDVFLVMELVDGETLGAWMERPHSWREVVTTLVAAGRGLAAAHAAELVHRDFKPHNVLLGRDGRVRVTDFGVVGVAGSASSADVLIGTPAYMAPEMHRQQTLDARADQFSFCVTLFEALYGQRPFDGDTPEALRAAICEGAVATPEHDRGVPSRIGEIVRRGLSRQPAARFASMDALLAELERDPSRPRRRFVAAAGITALTTLAVFGWTRGGGPPRPTENVCAVEPQLAAVWDDPTRLAIRDAFVAARPGRGADTFARVAVRLDDYLGRWSDAYAAACPAARPGAAHQVHAEMACLAELRDEVRELTGLFRRDTDGVVVDGAVAAIAALTPIDRCAAPTGRPRQPILDPARRARAETVRGRLGRAEALGRAGLVKEAVELAAELAIEADEIADPALIAETQLQLGLVQMQAKDGVPAEVALGRAALAGSEVGDDLLIARAETALVWVVGYLRSRQTDALAMHTLAAAAVVRAGSPSRLRADLLFYYAGMLVELGRYDDAVPYLEQARMVWREELDPHDPASARPIQTLGNVAKYRGHTAEARGLYLEALAIREAALGPDHIDLSGTLGNLGSLSIEMGEPERGRAYCQRSLEIIVAALGTTTRARIHELRCLGRASADLGDLPRARALLEEAVAADEDNPDGGAIYYSLTDLGEIAIDQGDFERAISLCDRAADLFTTEPTQDHPDVARALACRGRALVGRGEPDAARAPLERALSLYEANGASPRDLGDIRFSLARALWPRPADRVRARTLAEQAVRDYQAAHRNAGIAAIGEWQAAIATP